MKTHHLAAISFAVLLSSCLLGSPPPPAIDRGFYNVFEGDLGFTAISDLKTQADRLLLWESSDEIYVDAELGESMDEAQVMELLRRDRRKRLVVVTFSKGMQALHDFEMSKQAARVDRALEGIGFRRVIVLGAAGSGVSCYHDSAQP